MLGRFRAGVSERLYRARALHARHLAYLSGGRLRDDSEGPFVQVGLRAARWSVVRGRWRLAGLGAAPYYVDSPIRAALFLLGLDDRRRPCAAAPRGVE